MNSTNELEVLRAAVADESLPLLDRKNAAAHLVALLVAAVPEPEDDDPEILALMTPWSDKELGEMWAEITLGRSVNGWSLHDAKAEVLRRHRERVVLILILNESAHRLERLAGCQVILDASPARCSWRVNHYTAEKLLDTIVPPDAIRWTSTGKRQVSRPAMDAGDLWP